MKIKEIDGTIVDIFASYWLDNKTLFLGMPKGYGGLCAFDLSEVIVIEKSLNTHVEFFQNNGINGFYHWALIKEALLDDLLELDETAYNRFLDIIKSEGLVEPDFY